jgi:hypothetical protein
LETLLIEKYLGNQPLTQKAAQRNTKPQNYKAMRLTAQHNPARCYATIFLAKNLRLIDPNEPDEQETPQQPQTLQTQTKEAPKV